MYCFSYGSNMATKYIRDYCPSATYVMNALLPNYHVEFRRYSTDMQGGISSIMEAPGDQVEGIVYDIARKEIEDLDILENVPEGIYRRDTFLVYGDDGAWHEADLYRAVSPERPYDPAVRYIGLMIEGAREHGLSEGYVARLQKIETRLVGGK